MRKFFMALVALIATVATAFAQADKIVGLYTSEHEGEKSKIKVFKVEDGYRAQITWVQNMKRKDGTLKTDAKNPDAKKRNTPADQIVLIEKVKYNAKSKQWDGGEIYDPTSGKSWTVVCTFDDEKTLKVRGSFGPFGKSVYWTKVE